MAAPGWRETHFPTPMHRSTAWRRSPPSAWWASDGSRATSVGRGRRRSCARGSGSTMIPGLRALPGSQAVFQARNAASIAGENWRSSSAPRARPSPCSPEREPPCATTSSAAAVMKEPSRPSPPGRSSPKPTRRWMQPSPKWPYVTPCRPWSRSSARSSPRYAARRSGGTTPSSKPGQAGEPSARRDARPAPSSRTRQRTPWAAASSSREASGAPNRVPAAVARRPAWSRSSAAVSPPTSTSSQAPPGGSRPGSRQPVSSSDVRLSTVNGPLGQQGRDDRRCGDVVGEGEDEQAARGRRPDEAERGLGDHGAGPLAPDERPGDVGSPLWEQPVQGVAGDPAGPRGQLAADRVAVGVEEAGDRAHRAPGRAPPSAAATRPG